MEVVGERWMSRGIQKARNVEGRPVAKSEFRQHVEAEGLVGDLCYDGLSVEVSGETGNTKDAGK